MEDEPVMGDGVNVASRLEGLNKQFGTSICISEDVYRQVKGRVVARLPGRIAVKGRASEIMVYELPDMCAVPVPAIQLAL